MNKRNIYIVVNRIIAKLNNGFSIYDTKDELYDLIEETIEDLKSLNWEIEVEIINDKD